MKTNSGFRVWICTVIGLLMLSAVGTLNAQTEPATSPRKYSKREVRIPMRDGITLHTTIYSPGEVEGESSKTRFPILIQRTPYGCGPYGDQIPETIMYNQRMVEAGYIFVYQDLRSRSMSDGDPVFENLKPVYSLSDPNRTDEVTDTHDTIDWLLQNVPQHNGSVGMFGSSYKGYTALMGAVTKHENLKAVMAAAPSVDIYFEDFNRYGLYVLAYTPILDWFGTPKTGRHEGPWWKNNLEYWADGKRFGLAKDSYDFYLKKGPLSNLDSLIPSENYFWQSIKDHPDYDEYRKQRNALQYLRGIKCAVLVVGGLNDEQNMYGILKSYQEIESQNPDADCRLVLGPWSHGQHRSHEENCYVGNVWYGDNLSKQYQDEIEFIWFEHHLKGAKDPGLAEATVFDTGTKRWNKMEQFPPPSQKRKRYLNAKEKLTELPPSQPKLELSFISDPAKPVPYIESDNFGLFPAKHFMTDDQRFASKRPDVLTFVSQPLPNELAVVGPITAQLKFSTDQTDADLIVKLIDVYPMDRVPEPTDLPNLKMNGYQQMVRCGYIRGRYREDFSAPKPFVSDAPTDVSVELLDVCHTFEPGHRIMIQVQSSLFPMFDRNPQKYVENIYFADEEDFVRAIHRLHAGSHITFSTK